MHSCVLWVSRPPSPQLSACAGVMPLWDLLSSTLIASFLFLVILGPQWRRRSLWRSAMPLWW